MTATVLVIDDLEPNVKLLEAKLLSEYYTVLTASSGQEAIALVKECKVDVILLDVMMPDMDGFEVCRLLKSNPNTTHIPVIMVTALSEVEDRVRGLEAGADEFLTKPIDDLTLFARVKALARMKASIDELLMRNETSKELGGKLLKLNFTLNSTRVLLIDDDILQARNLKVSLVEFANEIKLVTSSEHLSTIEDFVPDLIIISCNLENEDPLRILATVKHDKRFKDSIIMMLTDEYNIPMVIKAMELGMHDYFIYPVDGAELKARVKTQLTKKYYQDNLKEDLVETLDLSTKDGLTGLFNRRYFDIHLNQMITRTIEHSEQFCLMMLDIDHFKEINDMFGHQCGDDVLKCLADELKKSLRITDTIARYGGEEFAAILRNTTLKESIDIAKRLRERIEDLKIPMGSQGKYLKRTISLGVAEYNVSENITDFLKRTDIALYQAKNNGRNHVVISEINK